MLRIMKILLVLSVALWGLVGAYGDVSDWRGTTDAVAATTSMSTFKGGPDQWQATKSPVVILAGAVFIAVSKVVSTLLCGAGAWRMWGKRGAESAEFAAAKTLALTGCAVSIFMLFAGFIVIGEGWYELWKSDAMRDSVSGTAFRYGGMIALIAIFVGARDD